MKYVFNCVNFTFFSWMNNFTFQAWRKVYVNKQNFYDTLPKKTVTYTEKPTNIHWKTTKYTKKMNKKLEKMTNIQWKNKQKTWEKSKHKRPNTQHLLYTSDHKYYVLSAWIFEKKSKQNKEKQKKTKQKMTQIKIYRFCRSCLQILRGWP